MKCPICNSNIDMNFKCCVKCGALLKGKRNKQLINNGLVDINKDSLEVIANVPGMTREDAVFIVRERSKRGGFINIVEITNFLNKSYEEMLELEKHLECTPISSPVREPVKQEEVEHENIPDEWRGYVGKIKSRNVLKEVEHSEKTTPTCNIVDINNDNEENISALPGIGTILAKRIVRERAERSGFKNIDELAEFLKLKQYIIDRIEPMSVFNDLSSDGKEKTRGRIVDF